MSTFISLRRFRSEGNTGSKFGDIKYKSISSGIKGHDFEILVNDIHTNEDIEAAKEFLKFLYLVNNITEVYEISEEEDFLIEEQAPKLKTLYDSLKDRTLEDFDDEINHGFGL